jgi:hypothetical protein
MKNPLIDKLSCALLSIVLSHHYQKSDVKHLVAGSLVDFGIVRETMYKYSKRAEDTYFNNSFLALLFFLYADSPMG